MATEFICTLKSTGGDYTTPAGFMSACACDLTSSATKVFSISSEAGSVGDGNSVTGSVSGATATVCHVTATQVLLKSISGTFQSGENAEVGVSNYVVLSDAGDDAAAVLEAYEFAGGLDARVDITTSWTTNATGNTVIFRAASGQEATMDFSSGFYMYYGSESNVGVVTITTPNVELRHLGLHFTRTFGTNGTAIKAEQINGTRVHACVAKMDKAANIAFRACWVYANDLSNAPLITASLFIGGICLYCANYNNVVVENSGAVNGTWGFYHPGTFGTEGINATNCFAYNNSTANYYGDSYFFNSSYNASDDYSGDPPPGTNQYTSDLGATDFDTVTAGSEDFHLGTSGNLDSAGTTGTYAFDFDDDAITTWPIGLDASGGGPTYTITAAVGAYTLTGVASGLIVSRKLAAGIGSYTLAGVAAGLSASRKITAEVGAYTLTGVAADLVYTPVGGPTYTLAAAVGAYTLTGIAAGLVVARKLSAATGAYTLTGYDATLTYTPFTGAYTMTAEAGNYTLTGFSATLTYNRASGWIDVQATASVWTEIESTGSNWTEV